jgi:hypothetical protein
MVAGVVGKCCHHQEGVGKHRQGGPAVPGAPAAHLVLVQATQALAGLAALPDPPMPARDPNQGGVLTRVWQRLLALTAAIWHNDHIGAIIKRSLTADDH